MSPAWSVGDLRVAVQLHFDCFSGVSGDMILGALVDAGLPFGDLVRGLNGLRLSGFTLRKRRVARGELHAVKVDVQVRKGFDRPLPVNRIFRILTASRLPDPVKRQSRTVFERLAEAEGRAHRVPQGRVHFHEVGVIDSFVDVVGGVLGCHLLGATSITASAINVGAGTMNSSHGPLPVPGPAVAVLAEGIPIYSAGPPRELATPTGVALLRTLSSGFGPLPAMTPAAVGYGAADSDTGDWPNVLRVFVSRRHESRGRGRDVVLQLETNLDDLNPQVYEHVMDHLFAAGALDVTLTPVIMKRGRPGIVLSALAVRGQADRVLDILFEETTALGVRVQEVARHILPRRSVSVPVAGGTVRVKVSGIDGKRVKATPEYLDCRRLAERTGRPVKQVLEDAALAYRRSHPGKNDFLP